MTIMRCMVQECVKKMKKNGIDNFEDEWLGMNAHFINHHPELHGTMFSYVEQLVNGKWISRTAKETKSIVPDEGEDKEWKCDKDGCEELKPHEHKKEVKKGVQLIPSNTDVKEEKKELPPAVDPKEVKKGD